MVDPTQKQSNVQRPLRPEPEQREEIDPEKFKKVLKVDASTEADKRRKRRMHKGEEEEEAFEQKSPLAPPADPTAFAKLMKDQNGKVTLFDPQSPGIQKRTIPKRAAELPPPPFNSPQGPPKENGFPQSDAQKTSSPRPSGMGGAPDLPPPFTPPRVPPDEGVATTSNRPQQPLPHDPGDQMQSEPIQNTPSRSQTTSQQRGGEVHAHKKKTKHPEKDTSLLASQPGRGALKSKKKKHAHSPPIIKTSHSNKRTVLKQGKARVRTGLAHRAHTGKTVPPNKSPLSVKQPHKPRAVAEKREIQQMQTLIPHKKKATPEIKGPTHERKVLHTSDLNRRDASPMDRAHLFSSAHLQEKEDPRAPQPQTIGKKKPQPPAAHRLSALTHLEEKRKEEKGESGKEEFPFISAEELIAALPASDLPLNPIAPPSDVPAYTHLSSDTYALFEKMVGAIIIQDQSGITSTTITLNIPHSVFDKAQITFDRYQTAPNSYNLQLKGTPEAVALFASNIDDLAAAFKQGQHAFEVNILRPALGGKKPLIRRKGGLGGGSGQSKK